MNDTVLAPTTHYIPRFTVRRQGVYEMTLCGVWVKGGHGTNEPTCPACQWTLTQPATPEKSN